MSGTGIRSTNLPSGPWPRESAASLRRNPRATVPSGSVRAEAPSEKNRLSRNGLILAW